MVPVRDGPQTAASPSKCGHHVAPPVPRKENRKGNQPGREGGRQKHHRRVLKDSEPVSPFVCSPLCGVATPRVLRTLLREVSQASLQLTAEERGLPGDPYQFWGWCPSKFKRSRSSTAALWANSSSIFATISATTQCSREEWCPLDLISTAPVRPPTGRILDDIRQSVYDLGHRANFDSATTSAIMQLSAVTQTPATLLTETPFGRSV